MNLDQRTLIILVIGSVITAVVDGFLGLDLSKNRLGRVGHLIHVLCYMILGGSLVLSVAAHRFVMK